MTYDFSKGNRNPKKDIMDKLEPKIVNQYLDLRRQAGEFGDQIEKRIHYILEMVWKTFDSKLEYWYVDGGDGQEGDLLKCFQRWGSGEAISWLCVSPSLEYDNDRIMLQDGKSIWGFGEGEIPHRWLFEDFEEELANGKHLYEEHLAHEKEKKRQKRELKKLEKEQLKAQAAAKLTPEERRALGL